MTGLLLALVADPRQDSCWVGGEPPISLLWPLLLVLVGMAVACPHRGLALFASCVRQKPSAITGRARTVLADRYGEVWYTFVFHHTSEPSSAMGVAVPHSWVALPEGRRAQVLPRALLAPAPQPSPTLAPRAVSPAHRSATNGEPSRQASPRLIGQWGCWGLQDAAYANEAPPIIPGSSVGWSRGNLM
ncbi:hypothetical protein HGM15179_007175 [Zosterops borbonicus]|uniref:Uncharacterized protein n=1 Tax=Zosterops borbonicus TaxID=364589 RepID=A0A8K1GKM4_9PASS|nr:hypothetical protein HGM15179_007175 [Zosterops borbonicus]